MDGLVCLDPLMYVQYGDQLNDGGYDTNKTERADAGAGSRPLGLLVEILLEDQRRKESVLLQAKG